MPSEEKDLLLIGSHHSVAMMVLNYSRKLLGFGM